MKAAIYCRVSTSEQSDNGYSLPTQRRACRKFAEDYDFDIAAEISDDISGITNLEDRPGGKRLLDMLHDINAIIVYRLDRLSRPPEEEATRLNTIIQGFQKAGVALYDCEAGEVKKDSMSQLIVFFKGLGASEERKNIRERSMRGRKAKIESGIVAGNGKPCYGYIKVGKKRETRLEVVEDEAEVIRLIYHLYCYGDGSGPMGMMEISRKLSAMGMMTFADKLADIQAKELEKKREELDIKVKSSIDDDERAELSAELESLSSKVKHGLGRGKKANRGVWTIGILYSILRNEVYTGVWYAYKYGFDGNKRIIRPRSEWAKIPIPPIIDMETWKEARRRLAVGNAKSRRNNTHYKYLMRCRMTCLHCGHSIQGRPCKGRNGKVYLYYSCLGRSHWIVQGDCTLPLFKVEETDDTVWNWVKSTLLDPQALYDELHRSQERARQANQALYDRLNIINEQIEGFKSQLSVLLDMCLEGKYSRDLFAEKQVLLEKRLKSLENERLDLEGHLGESNISDNDIYSIQEFASEMADELNQEFTYDEKVYLLDKLNVSVKLSYEDGQKIIHVKSLIDAASLSITSVNHCRCRGQNV